MFLFFLYQYISNLPKAVTRYAGVSLGMGMDEVMYVMGYPPDVLIEDKDDELRLANGETVRGKMLLLVDKKSVENSKNGARDYLYWQYPVHADGSSSIRIDIEFNKTTKLVESIGCYVNDKNWVSLGSCAINGIQSLDSEEVIISKLGKPSFESIEGVTKNIKYSNLNMSIYLSRKMAYYIKVEKN